MFSEATQIALIAAAFPTVSIVVSSYFQYKASKKADVKLDEIHTLTNSTLTTANKRIEHLEDVIKRTK